MNDTAGAWTNIEYYHRSMSFIRKLPYSVELMGTYSSITYSSIICILAFHDGETEDAWEWTKEPEKHAHKHHQPIGLVYRLYVMSMAHP